ncbi:hypothetical protein [Streptomyces chiangmaiensis]|uniref:Uncharacterized protein n=1 Tax=Streptomyces chiangmaiensis TaxID=766497 RepID=A0ABU7FNT2_9ACTN|nr:hypothetical protein [Streptomyces chiangmaiensis]MED7825412.1 hypothetical protein [Streptomyces chiangmaiensis]
MTSAPTPRPKDLTEPPVRGADRDVDRALDKAAARSRPLDVQEDA